MATPGRRGAPGGIGRTFHTRQAQPARAAHPDVGKAFVLFDPDHGRGLFGNAQHRPIADVAAQVDVLDAALRRRAQQLHH
jgi:hypothetical protein